VGAPARTPGAIHKFDRADRSAKRLRKSPSFAETKLWKALRKLEIEGSHFRRQAPFRPYIVDFVCHAGRLVIEVDGGVHDLAQVAARDLEREKWLQDRGYSVFRVRNEDVVGDLDIVVLAIRHQLGANTPTPNPSPQGGGGQI
jgi:very-short-patch-repair endonuclease